MTRAVAHHRGVGHDQRVRAQFGGLVGRGEPRLGVTRVGKGVQRHQHLSATPMRVGDAFADLCLVEVQAGEVAGVGCVLQAQVDGIGASIHGHGEGSQAAGWADKLGA